MIVEVLGGPRDGDILELRDNLVQVSLPEIIGTPPLDVEDGPQGLTMVTRTLPIQEYAYARTGAMVFRTNAGDFYWLAVEETDQALRDEFTPPTYARRYDRLVSLQHDGPLMVVVVEVAYIWKVAVW